ncbi:MAG: hypothetical protein ACQESR_18455 [Planctomycetota bacterium]
MPRLVALVASILLALSADMPVAADLIANGNFASTAEGKLDHWTHQAGRVRVPVASAISGESSAEIVGPHGNNLYQTPADAVSSFVFQMDFAVFDVAGGDRTMNVLLYCGPGANSIAVNLRVGGGNRLQAFDGGAWRDIGTLTARTTADTGEQGVWDGEAPVVNRLEMVGHLAAKTPYYNVMLNGETGNYVRLFQQPLPSGATVGRIQLQALNAPGNWLADTVSLTPGPAPEEIPSPKLLAGFLKGPMVDVEEIVYAERVTEFDHYYATFGFLSSTVPEYPPRCGIEDEQLPPRFGEGGRLVRYNVRTGERMVLLDDPTGGVRDPQVHYDGRTILFSYRRGGQPYYHLYEIQADGSGLVQLTDGSYDDIEPTYLPDGGILFGSSRCNRFVSCWRTPVAVLYRCEADGSNIRRLSTNAEHDNTPWVMPDGRVLFTRWEYVDRSQFDYHHLWTINPDGTGQMTYYGNQRPGTAMLDAKPIPGTNRVVASFSPGHGRPGHMGHITIVDPSKGPDAPACARRVSSGRMYRDPYPFSEDCFLVADEQGIHVMDGQGQTERVCTVPPGCRLECQEPRPLVPRERERVIPRRIDFSQATGRLLLGDIYHGRNMEGVRRGEIKKLLVLHRLPKPISFSGGMWPITAGGSFQLASVLGTVPVAEDGSAYFEAPAMRSLFFVALDENDLAVKRMHSFVSVQPGEVTGCVGCHENRTTAPLLDTGQVALFRRPDRIEPITGMPDVFDFSRDIQPILDKHCVECHNPDRPEGRVDLTGDHTPIFCQSYWAILRRGLISDARNGGGNRPPRSVGSAASPLLDYLDGSHHDVRLSDTERTAVRLWIEASAVYAGTYAALGSGMAPVDFPVAVLEKRCGSCHGTPVPERGRIGQGELYFRFGPKGPHLPLVHKFSDLQKIRGSIGYYQFGNARPPQSLCDLTRPEKSLLLRAPLSPEAGGLGWCGKEVFADTEDPDYQVVLAAIVAASDRLAEIKRFDMPGFRPNVYYLRKLQQYGILPPDHAPGAPLDFRAVERAYWRSFHYDPAPRTLPARQEERDGAAGDG